MHPPTIHRVRGLSVTGCSLPLKLLKKKDIQYDDHSRRKHKILREYFFDYLTVRCKLPQQERFRLAIVDGFAGGGRYECGAAGSPLIFIEELKRAIEAVNVQRAAQGIGTIEIESLLILNDRERAAVELLKTHIAPLQAEISQSVPKLHLRVEYLNHAFAEAYPKIKELLERGRYRSVIFNLDQCGHSHVERGTILDIMRSYPSAEIFYTFVISSLLAFLQKADPERLRTQLAYLELQSTDIDALAGVMSRNDWLGTADVHGAIIDNPDLEVITPAGGERRKANTIGVNDIIKLKTQRSFFPMFLRAGAANPDEE